MDYYQPSSPPELDPKNLSGGVLFNFNGSIASGGAQSNGSGGVAFPVLQRRTQQTSRLPWDVYLNNGEYKVWPGTIAGILPNNILDSFSVSASLTYWICTCYTDGKQITSATISTSTTYPDTQTLVPSSLPYSAAFIFAITQDGLSYRTIGIGNPNVVYNQAIVTDKTESPPFGVPGVDRWYNIIFQ
jgi:hypothetical protein